MRWLVASCGFIDPSGRLGPEVLNRNGKLDGNMYGNEILTIFIRRIPTIKLFLNAKVQFSIKLAHFPFLQLIVRAGAACSPHRALLTLLTIIRHQKTK
jgi:hypothetical protein